MKTEDTGGELGSQPARTAGSASSLIPHPSSLHRIRLGPPWEVVPVEGGTRHTRKFGRPRTLDANEHVWLLCDHIPGATTVRVNGSVVGTPEVPGPFAADITSILQPRNEVTFTVGAEQALGAVVLEIRTE